MRDFSGHFTIPWVILRDRPAEIIRVKDHLINQLRYDSRIPQALRPKPRLKDIATKSLTRQLNKQAPSGYAWLSEMVEYLAFGEEFDVPPKKKG